MSKQAVSADIIPNPAVEIFSAKTEETKTKKLSTKGTKFGIKFAIPHKIFIFRAGINSSFPADRARRD
jgi:hypothetical protein